MSLEMIIGLLILLVVAAVIINLFMDRIKQFTSTNWQQDLDFKKFKSDCESYCKENTEGSIAKYCSEKLNKKDLNGNHKVDTMKSETSVLSMCEDAIYCFHVASCERDGDAIDAKACKGILCRSWTDVYGDASKASTKVMELVPGYGTCTLNDDENWWLIAKFGPNPPCGGKTTQTSVSLNCVKSSETSMSCVWICPYINQGTLSVSGTSYSGLLPSVSGSSPPIIQLTAGNSYTVTLVCDATNSAYSTVKTVQL